MAELFLGQPLLTQENVNKGFLLMDKFYEAEVFMGNPVKAMRENDPRYLVPFSEPTIKAYNNFKGYQKAGVESGPAAVVSFASGTPIFGSVGIGTFELLDGRSLQAEDLGRDLTTTDKALRVVAIAADLLPFAGKALGKAGKAISGTGKSSEAVERAVEKHGKAVQAIEEFREAAKAGGKTPDAAKPLKALKEFEDTLPELRAALNEAEHGAAVGSAERRAIDEVKEELKAVERELVAVTGELQGSSTTRPDPKWTHTWSLEKRTRNVDILTERMGIGPLETDGRSAHHIVNSTSRKDPSFQKARDLLLEHQIDINSPANGVALQSPKATAKPNPGLRIHKGDVPNGDHLHSGVGGERTLKRLEDAVERAGSDWGARRQAILDELDLMRKEILAGTFP